MTQAGFPPFLNRVQGSFRCCQGYSNKEDNGIKLAAQELVRREPAAKDVKGWGEGAISVPWKGSHCCWRLFPGSAMLHSHLTPSHPRTQLWFIH